MEENSNLSPHKPGQKNFVCWECIKTKKNCKQKLGILTQTGCDVDLTAKRVLKCSWK